MEGDGDQIVDANEHQVGESSDADQVTKKINHLKSQCKLLVSELEMAIEFVEAAEKSKDDNAAKLEMEDLVRIEGEYFSTYRELISLYEMKGIDTNEIMKNRKSFVTLLKETRIRAIRIVNAAASSVNTTVLESSTKRLKFSKIDFDSFDGKKENWINFKKLFCTYVHDNKELLAIEKHRLLCSKLKGDPATLVSALEIDGSSYEKAWEILLSHYDDPLKKISRHLDAIFQISPVKGQQLRSLVTHFRSQFVALNITFNENKEVDILSQFVIHLFLMKADKGARLEWEKEVERRQKFATFDEFIQFMEGRCNAYERAVSNGIQKGQVLLNTKQSSEKCFYCGETNHRTHTCKKFLALSIYERNQSIRKRRLCPKCFRGKCDRNCQFRCQKCNRHHNTLLHYDREDRKANITTESSQSTASKEQSVEAINSSNSAIVNQTLSQSAKNIGELSTIISCSLINCAQNYVNGWVGLHNSEIIGLSCPLLATALIHCISRYENSPIEIRALLDPGSHFNLITSEVTSKLQVPKIITNYVISGVENTVTNSRALVNVTIKSRINSFKLNLKCLVLDKIIDCIPSEFFSTESWNFPNYLTLADPSFNIPGKIDMLIGGGAFWKALKPQTTKLKNMSSKIFMSQFGWLIAGDVINTSTPSHTFSTLNDDINKNLERFWLFDNNIPEKMTFEEMECEEHFLRTFQRNEYGHFICSLPFKIPREELGESRPQALRRFYALERKLQKDEILKQNYVNGINDYLDQNHMRLVTHIKEGEISYYAPHRAVIKEDSTSTKIRIVFDASEPTTTGLSLNDCLMTGPVIQADLFSILIKSRMYAFLFTADISQMYRQVHLNENDTPLVRILWRNEPAETIKTYELTTLPFGLSCSSYVATRCLNLLAEISGEELYKGKNALLYDCYVDNILSGADSYEEAQEIIKQLTQILESGGFSLKKWCSNDSNLLAGIPPQNLEKKFPFYFGNEVVIKALGIIWDPTSDYYKIWVHTKESEACTKREILSIIASIFDPFGILAPFTIRAKIWMQELWKLNVKWDEILPQKLIAQWAEFSSEFSILEQISIPRLIKCQIPKFIEIHGFSDASEKAYGGAVYVRIISENNVSCRLLCAKTKVAPLKKISIARLELCGALVLMELVFSVKEVLRTKWQINNTRLWCDSQISLCWINSNPSRWLPFISNRVQKIQQKQGDALWDYIKTGENPADLLSRGLKSEMLKDNNLWWYGPQFLTNNNRTFSKEIEFQPSRVQPLEVRQAKKIFACSLIHKNSIILKFSNYIKLIRVTAYVQRFIWNLDSFGPFLIGPLQSFELRQSLITLIGIMQKECFGQELKKLMNGENVDKSSSLSTLNPFLDTLNVIRVGGRLSQSNLSFEQKFPIILSGRHHFTKLLVKYEHEKNLHSSLQAMRSILRRNYWILRQDTAIQHCILHCIKCIRLKADTRAQMMASLPKARVVPAKVFHNVGVDYAGPMKLLIRRGKGSRNIETKAYISIFICFVTKAMHLELVSDLTTEAFLAAFDRFIGRRGLPANIWSDNGTNFVGASNQIKELFTFFKKNESHLLNSIQEHGCTWHFIPPHSPSFGGLWEAGVKSIKTLLIKTIGNTLLTYEQFETLLIKVEACLNSRPLFLESSDPNDINALTPSHFLIGGPITALPNSDISEVPINRLKYWQLSTQKMQSFWKRWSQEYLNKLQQRNKWKQNKNEVKVGDIVIVKEDNCPPLYWPLAKIIDLHPGTDEIVRVVTLKMRVGPLDKLKKADGIKMGNFKRPVSKLVYLPDPTQPY